MTRTLARTAVLLTFALVFTAVSTAAKPPRDRTPPTAPKNLRLTVTGPYSVSLAWDKASDSSSNWWYCVQRDGLGCYRVDPPKTTFSISRLLPNTTFRYSVIAIDAAGNRSASSNTVTYTTPPDTTPPSPAPVLSTTAVYPTRVYLSWTGSTDDISQVWYALEQDGVQVSANQLGYRSATILDLTPATTYTFKVTARDASGNKAESNVLSVTTPAATDATPPSAPTNLRLSSETSAPEIWLDWDASTDDSDPESEILYDVYINGEPEHGAIGGTDTIVYCRATGENRIVLRAVDTSGNVSGPSNEIVFVC